MDFIVLAYWNNRPDGKHVASREHSILVPSQPVFVLTSVCCMLTVWIGSNSKYTALEESTRTIIPPMRSLYMEVVQLKLKKIFYPIMLLHCSVLINLLVRKSCLGVEEIVQSKKEIFRLPMIVCCYIITWLIYKLYSRKNWVWWKLLWNFPVMKCQMNTTLTEFDFQGRYWTRQTKVNHFTSLWNTWPFWLSCLGPLVLIAPKTLYYLAFQSFDSERTRWRFFQKRIARTKFYIYVFI
jgi:hypothetical protein